MGVIETEESLKVEVAGVCRKYCLQVWNEAFNQARVEASFAFRRAENIYCLPAIRALGSPHSSSPQGEHTFEKADEARDSLAKVFPSSTSPIKEAEQARATKKEKGTSKGVVPKTTKPPTAPKVISKGGEAPHNLEIVLAIVPILAKEDPKGKGPASTVTEAAKLAKGTGKENPPLKIN